MTSQTAQPSPARPASLRRRLADATDRLIDEIVDYRAVVLLRVAAGPLVLIHLGPFLAASLHGETYRDRFHIPVVGWYPELPETVYMGAMWVAAVAAISTAAGLFTRAATITTASFLVYNLFVTETHYHHNRAFLVVLLVGLALMPVGERISLDAALGRIRSLGPGMGPRWPLTLLRFQMAVVYAASGISKLLDPDWINGVVLRLRVASQADAAAARGIPVGVLDVATSPSFQWWFAKVVVATEIFIGLGLLFRRTRWAAVWLAIAFHVAIELSAEVEVFSYAGIAALVIWVTPRSSDRRIQAPDRWPVVVRALDWTGRFSTTRGATWRLVDRDGVELAGADAAWRAATLLPVTFWVAAPFAALRRRRAR